MYIHVSRRRSEEKTRTYHIARLPQPRSLGFFSFARVHPTARARQVANCATIWNLRTAGNDGRLVIIIGDVSRACAPGPVVTPRTARDPRTGVPQCTASSRVLRASRACSASRCVSRTPPNALRSFPTDGNPEETRAFHAKTRSLHARSLTLFLPPPDRDRPILGLRAPARARHETQTPVPPGVHPRGERARQGR